MHLQNDRQYPLPTLETQKSIADFLDRETARIDQLIEKKERLVALLLIRTRESAARLCSLGHKHEPLRVTGIDVEAGG